MHSLISRIERAAESDATLTVASPEGYDTTTWAQTHSAARSLAAGLQTYGVTPGTHVAILGPTTRPLITAIQATWLTGGCLVMLPLPMRLGSIEAFVEQTRSRIRAADCSLVLIDEQFAAFVERAEGDPPFVVLQDLVARSSELAPADWKRPDDDPDALAVLQFTSGSTAEPKGVMLPHRTICANLDACTQAGGLIDDEVFVSWLPLYHDMGLVGLLTIPMTTGRNLVQAAPQDFLSRPARWMQWISDYGGTMTAGPNFAYALAARALRRAEELDLSSLEVLLNGAEPIDADVFRRFLAAGEPFGLRPGAAFPAFGMAEVGIGGAFSRRWDGFRTDVVDADALEHEHVARPPSEDGAPEGEKTTTRELALLGRAVPGLEMRVVDRSSGQELGDRQVGELLIRGTSVTPGYYKNPEATAELLVDGWLHTGDLAYLLDGELVVCGRIKDVIIVGGRNIYPQDIERSAGDVAGVRPGNVIAFGADGRAGAQSIVVVAELGDAEAATVRDLLTERITSDIGVPPKEVVMVAKGTVPKTSSGKLQRSLAKSRWLNGELETAGTS